MRGEFALVCGEMASLEGRLRPEMGDMKAAMGAPTRTIMFANLGAVIGVGGLVLAAAGSS